MMDRCANTTALADTIMIYMSGSPKTTTRMSVIFPHSFVSGTKMVILKQRALNGLCRPLAYSQIQQEMV